MRKGIAIPRNGRELRKNAEKNGKTRKFTVDFWLYNDIIKNCGHAERRIPKSRKNSEKNKSFLLTFQKNCV